MAEPQVVLRRSARRRRTVTAYRQGSDIVVLVPAAMPANEERRLVDEMVRKVLAREARREASSDDDLARRADRLVADVLAPRLGYVPRAASITWVSNQHSRWGSCTPGNGTIRLSDRLVATPDWVIDYVLVHELTHLVEPNHTARFWSLVDAYPDVVRAKAFLEGYAYARAQAARAG